MNLTLVSKTIATFLRRLWVLIIGGAVKSSPIPSNILKT